MVLLAKGRCLTENITNLGPVIPSPLSHLCGQIETPLDRFHGDLTEFDQLHLGCYRDLLELVDDLALDRERCYRDRRQFTLQISNSVTETSSVIRTEIEFSRRRLQFIKINRLVLTRKRILCLLRRCLAGAVA